MGITVHVVYAHHKLFMYVRYIDSTCKFSARLIVSNDDQSWPRIGISLPGATWIPFRSRYLTYLRIGRTSVDDDDE